MAWINITKSNFGHNHDNISDYLEVEVEHFAGDPDEDLDISICLNEELVAKFSPAEWDYMVEEVERQRIANDLTAKEFAEAEER